MSRSLLELNVADKRFEARRVIDGVAFELRAGEIVSLLGPSGCGKSTLLRIVAGLDEDYRGRVRVNGGLPQLHSPDVGFIFQEPRLLPWLTVADNVGFDAGRGGGRHPRVRELLAEVGLADFADAYPKQLSGGMAQRAAIARGLFAQPALLLLDEPFSAVDAFTRMRLQDLLLSLAARHGTTLLLVTHDIDEAAYLSDRIVVMASGPGRIAGELEVRAARPRDRADPELARVHARALSLLNGERLDCLDLTEELASRPRPFEPVDFASLSFAV
ncbi:ABC transporter ATP-binding protein [Thauera sinica]|uniref:ABC transporter ATP-binding protein n=1 Tax=Thauera sinica TaxID=2665146 RepID=A0ABW1APU0_9RHOO|nr:ABC transporter ATP-binding protein [Thauera sp. K11]ATE59484.1 sulfonate ABC transporter ATP-binding protein [Thauera sp. K11]